MKSSTLNFKKVDGLTPREIIRLTKVGYGGFSLRRIEVILRYLHRYWLRLRIPYGLKTLQFALKLYPKRAVEQYNQGQLPFGCHAWNIHGTEYWRLFFAQYGY